MMKFEVNDQTGVVSLSPGNLQEALRMRGWAEEVVLRRVPGGGYVGNVDEEKSLTQRREGAKGEEEAGAPSAGGGEEEEAARESGVPEEG